MPPCKVDHDQEDKISPSGNLTSWLVTWICKRFEHWTAMLHLQLCCGECTICSITYVHVGRINPAGPTNFINFILNVKISVLIQQTKQAQKNTKQKI